MITILGSIATILCILWLSMGTGWLAILLMRIRFPRFYEKYIKYQPDWFSHLITLSIGFKINLVITLILVFVV